MEEQAADPRIPMNIVYVFVGAFPVWVFLIKRDLLVKNKSFRFILILSAALFLIGVLLHFTEFGRGSASGALAASLIDLALYRALHKVFVRWQHHEPRETFIESGPGLGADMLFNFTFFSLAMLISMSTAIGMRALVKAGF